MMQESKRHVSLQPFSRTSHSSEERAMARIMHDHHRDRRAVRFSSSFPRRLAGDAVQRKCLKITMESKCVMTVRPYAK